MLTIAAGAERDIEAAARWYNSERRGLGDDFVDAIERGLTRIESAPESFAVWRTDGERAVRRCVIRGFPYSVLFVIDDHGPVVIAVAHFRRRPGHWDRPR